MVKRLLTAALFLYSICVCAQSTDVLIRENYNDTLFPDFVSVLEDKYDLQFFYDNNLYDSLRVKQATDDSGLVAILNKSFTGLSISNYIDKSGHVFITKDYEIVVSLPIYFYEVDNDDVQKTSNASFLYDRQPVKKRKQLSSTVIIGNASQKNVGSEATIRGTLIDNATGEPVIGAVIWSVTEKRGTASDLNGNYILELKKGKHAIEIRSVGKETIKQNVVLYDDGQLNYEMYEQVMQLADVKVVAEKFKNVEGLQMGLEKVNVETIKQLPTAMGEVDVLKVALMLPGVQTVGEAASGFNVRGGSTDQNLILIDQSPLFNTSHLFGFFSVFNPDIINDFILYKSAIPSRFGGRVSSVFDVSSNSGNKREWHLNAGISPVTGKVMIEGPVIKDRTSILLAGRTTYSDWILSKIDHPTFRESEAYFYDLNAKIKHEINEKHFLSLSFYNSSDYYKLNSDSTYNYSNLNSTLHWKYIVNNSLFINTYAIFSNYTNSLTEDENEYTAFTSTYNISYKELKTDVNYTPSARHKINFGISGIHYSLEPGTIEPLGDSSLVEYDEVQQEKAIEASIFIEDEIKLTEYFAVKAGIRYAAFFALGDREVYEYADGVSMSENSITDTIYYGSGDVVKMYHNPEWRLSARYKTGENNSVKFSYNRLYQYIHMMSNTTSVSPTDIWKLSDYYIEPQKADLFTLGYYQDFYKHVFETSVEVYYKALDNQLAYKGGAELNNNHTIEADLLSGIGKAYGIEMLIKKKHGYLNGWLAYTYSRSFMKVDGEYDEEKINDGDWFPANYDKPHDLTLVLNNKFSRRLSFSTTVTYSTGRPTTYPVGKYVINGQEILHYSDRNEYRIPDYFRWDLSVNIEGNLKKKKIAKSYWSVSVYNVTGRDNVYSEYFKEDDNGEITGYRLSIFARPILTITYNVKI